MVLFSRLPILARFAGAALLACVSVLSPVNGAEHPSPPAPATDTGQTLKHPRVMALGDSLMAGYNLPPGQSVPDHLSQLLERDGTPVVMINGGVSGDTSAGGLARLERMLKNRPDVVILELGANDALQGINSKETRINLNMILHRLRRDSVRVLLLGMRAPPYMEIDYSTDFNAVYPELAVMHGIPLVPFFLEGVAGNPALLQPDGMHPTNEGTETIAHHILPWLKPLVMQPVTHEAASGPEAEP